MQRSEQINELAAALAKAQGQIENAAADSANPYFKSTYADLASVWDACRKALSDNGLAVMQPVQVDRSAVTVTTLLAHGSGQWISSDLVMIAQRQLKDGGGWEKLDSPQAIGSIITYARRYALAAIVGIAPEDDDAEGAEGRNTQPVHVERPLPQRKADSIWSQAAALGYDREKLITKAKELGIQRVNEATAEEKARLLEEIKRGQA